MYAFRKIKIDPYLSFLQNLAPNEHLKIKRGTQNLIEEKMGNSLALISIEEDFLNRTVIAQTLKSTINE